MTTMLRTLLTITVGLTMLCACSVTVRAQDAAAAEATEIESKLLKLTTLEEAFLKAVRTRNLLQRFLVQEQGKLAEATDDTAKAGIQTNIDEGRRRLQVMGTAMDVVFGIGQRREYEYNQVTSTIYLKVGTVEEAFTRAIRTRDVLAEYVTKQKAALEQETDAGKKTGIQNAIDVATRQYQVVVAALQVVFNVVPQRNYLYSERDSTLYLRITEDEVEKLKEQVLTLQREREAAAGK